MVVLKVGSNDVSKPQIKISVYYFFAKLVTCDYVIIDVLSILCIKHIVY